MTQPNRVNRLYRWHELPDVAGLKATQIDKLRKAGKFPKPIPLSDGGRAIAWLEEDIAQWQAERIAARDAKTGGA